MNYSVNVDVQVHWCEAQKHQLFQIEIFFFILPGELEAFPYWQTFTGLHLCYLGKGQGSNGKFLYAGRGKYVTYWLCRKCA